MAGTDDEELFVLLKSGDKTALASLFRKYYDFLFHFGCKITQNEVLVEDCIQELFLYLFEARDRIGAVRNIKAYLFVSFKRRLQQKTKVESKFLAEDVDSEPGITFSPEDSMIENERLVIVHKMIHKALNELGPRQREAVYLRYYMKLSTEEISEVMGISKQTVLNTLHQTIRRLYDMKYLKELITLSTPLLFFAGQFVLACIY